VLADNPCHRLLFKAAKYDGNMLLQAREQAYESAAGRFYLAFDIDPTPLVFTTPPLARVAYLAVCIERHNSPAIVHALLRRRDGSCRVFSAETPAQLHVIGLNNVALCQCVTIYVL
jgi:hypothetical protein